MTVGSAYEASMADAASEADQALEDLELGVIEMATIQPERIDWLWPGRIPRGKLTILEGDPKVGKSTLMLDVAARVTTGTPFPDNHRPEAGVVLIMTAEDGLADTVRPRLDAAGAAVDRVIAWEAVPVYDAEGNPSGMRPPSIPRDLDSLEQLISAHCVSLVVVDVLNAYLGADVDGHRDQDVRRALMPLAKLAERTRASVVVLRHLNKSTGGPAIYRGAGSIGIGGAARSILLAGFDPEDEDRNRRVLASQGSNVAETPESLSYELVSTEERGCARVRWIGVSEHRAGSLLAAGSDEDRSALSEACDVLEDILSGGDVAAKEVQRRATEAGVSWATLRRAKGRLDVKSRKAATGWVWALPEAGQDDHGDDQGARTPSDEHLEHLACDQGLFGSVGVQGAQDAQDARGRESEHLEVDRVPGCPSCGAPSEAPHGPVGVCGSCWNGEA